MEKANFSFSDIKFIAVGFSQRSRDRDKLALAETRRLWFG